MRTGGLILAGGASRRMGGPDKAFLTLAGETLLARAVRSLGPQVVSVAISSNADPARFAFPGAIVLADAGSPGLDARQGPLAGLLAGLAWAERSGLTHLATVPVDAPFLPGDVVERLAGAPGAELRGAYAASADGAHPTAALWPLTALRFVSALYAKGERRLGYAAKEAGLVRVHFDDPAAVQFLNINTPEDLARAEKLMSAS